MKLRINNYDLRFKSFMSSIRNYQFVIRNSKKGFTIVEVLIFVSLISMLFVVISYGITATLRDARISEQKIVATHNGDELKEWLRSEKETDWQVFITHIESSDALTMMYCFPTTEEILSWPDSGTCADFDTNGFKRQVTLTLDSGHTKSTIDITVSWLDHSNNYQIKNQTIFSVYE